MNQWTVFLLLIWFRYQIVIKPAILLQYVGVSSKEFNFSVININSLNAHDLFYCISDVELRNIFTEFTCLDLGIVKEILNHEAHEISRSFLNIHSVI